VEEQRMTEGEVINVLKLANNDELPYLQGKVEYFRNEINKLELRSMNFDFITHGLLIETSEFCQNNRSATTLSG